MKIAKYIGELIYDYECVVIPGLGGFISSEQSSMINEVTSQISPPSRNIHFNTHIKANDGLLINYVARNEGMSYKNAKSKVDKFAHLCHNALKNGKRINFSKIGYLYLDYNKNVVFKQDTSINYNADSFGLNTFVSPIVRRPNTEEKIKEVFSSKTNKENPQLKHNPRVKHKPDRRVPAESDQSTRMIARAKPSKVKQQLIFVFLILFVASAYYLVNRRHAAMYYLDRYKVGIPLLYSNPTDYLASNAGLLPIKTISKAGWFTSSVKYINDKGAKLNKNSSKEEIDLEPANKKKEEGSSSFLNDKDKLQENTSIQEDNNPETSNDDIELEGDGEITIIEYERPKAIVKEDKIKIQPKQTAEINNKANKFFIIAGSFKSEYNAKKLVKSLASKGFDAVIADTNSYGMYRVAYMGFGDMMAAERNLLAVRRDTNPDAWILKK